MKTEKLLLAATLLLILVPSMAAAQAEQPTAAAQPPQPAAAAPSAGIEVTTPLSNKDVLVMVDRKIEAETIVKTIKSSPCTFDTFPPLLKEMKRRGVPDAVLHAMLEAPYGPSIANSSKDDLGEQPIYHYAEQLKQLGFLSPVPTGRGLAPMRSRTRASRARADY